MIEASRFVLFVCYRGQELICRVHFCDRDCSISCTRIDCACADDFLQLTIYTATGDVVKVVYTQKQPPTQSYMLFEGHGV